MESLNRRAFLLSTLGAAVAPSIDAADIKLKPAVAWEPHVGDVMSLTGEQVMLHAQMFKDFSVQLEPVDDCGEDTGRRIARLHFQYYCEDGTRITVFAKSSEIQLYEPSQIWPRGVPDPAEPVLFEVTTVMKVY